MPIPRSIRGALAALMHAMLVSVTSLSLPATSSAQPPAVGTYRASAIALVQPADGGTVAQDRTGAVFRLTPGEPTDPIDVGSLRVIVDGEDRSSRFQVAGTDAWGPLGDGDIALGPHAVSARICSIRGICGSVAAMITVVDAPAVTDASTTLNRKQHILQALLGVVRKLLEPSRVSSGHEHAISSAVGTARVRGAALPARPGSINEPTVTRSVQLDDHVSPTISHPVAESRVEESGISFACAAGTYTTITPCDSSKTVGRNGENQTVAFTVRNTSALDESYDLRCNFAAPVTSCTVPPFIDVRAGNVAQVTANFATGPDAGTATLELEATAPVTAERATGSYVVTVSEPAPPYAISVTPDGVAVGALPATSSVQGFSVKNTGATSATYVYSVLCEGSAIANPAQCAPSTASSFIGSGVRSG